MAGTIPRRLNDGKGGPRGLGRRGKALQPFTGHPNAKNPRLSRNETLTRRSTAVQNDHPPGIFVTEVLHPADSRGRRGLFDEAKAKELAGLAERGVNEIVCEEEVSADANILGGRFVLAIKNLDTKDEAYKT